MSLILLKASNKLIILWENLSPRIATIASVDNFDMLQTHAAVYQGRQHRSYHGTTIQLVQPPVSIQQEEIEAHLPSPIEFEQQPNAVTVYTDTHTRRRHIGSSPESSPHKLGKVGPKKRRTIAMITPMTTAHIQPSPYSQSPYRSIPINHFSLSEEEKRCVIKMNMELLNIIFLKVAGSDLKLNLPEMRHFLHPCEPSNSLPSNIYYMNILNENVDNDSTMLKVSEDLLDEFDDVTLEQDWVLLVGDGKTYQHLTNIKNTYGETLKKLLIFPVTGRPLKISNMPL